GSDVEEHQLVGPVGLVAPGHFHGVAGVAQLKEVHPLDDPAAVHVQTRNNALGEHERRRTTVERTEVLIVVYRHPKRESIKTGPSSRATEFGRSEKKQGPRRASTTGTPASVEDAGPARAGLRQRYHRMRRSVISAAAGGRGGRAIGSRRPGGADGTAKL